MKKALITGIYGQDGSFIYELLKERGYQVYGIVRSSLSENSQKVKDELSCKGELPLVYEVDLQCYHSVKKVIEELAPDEIYHLSASHVSSEGKRNGEATDDNILFQKNISATANLLAACWEASRHTKFLTAGSCLMFDASDTVQQDETTPYRSASLYGIGKITENQLVSYYRDKGLFACTAILYNHESHRRSEDFVTKKIVKNMCMLKENPQHSFSLGDIEIKKDWGYAGDYVKGMHLMMQTEKPDDYILASGELHSIRNLLEVCAEILELENWERHISLNSTFIHRTHTTQLYGNATRAEKELGWKREKQFRDWILEMIVKTKEQL